MATRKTLIAAAQKAAVTGAVSNQTSRVMVDILEELPECTDLILSEAKMMIGPEKNMVLQYAEYYEFMDFDKEKGVPIPKVGGKPCLDIEVTTNMILVQSVIEGVTKAWSTTFQDLFRDKWGRAQKVEVGAVWSRLPEEFWSIITEAVKAAEVAKQGKQLAPKRSKKKPVEVATAA